MTDSVTGMLLLHCQCVWDHVLLKTEVLIYFLRTRLSNTLHRLNVFFRSSHFYFFPPLVQFSQIFEGQTAHCAKICKVFS